MNDIKWYVYLIKSSRYIMRQYVYILYTLNWVDDGCCMYGKNSRFFYFGVYLYNDI